MTYFVELDVKLSELASCLQCHKQQPLCV